MAGEQTWADNVAYRLVRLGHVAGARFAEKLAALGLRPRQVGVLDRLEAGPMAQLELARALGVAPSVVVDMVDELEAMDAVRRERDPGDRRRQNVVLTRRGRSLARRALHVAYEVDADLLGQLSARQSKEFRSALQRIEGTDAES